ncbi:3-dehydroquinate dehydratase [Janibacter sp. Soil728]|uniref:type II 3-dehydroquinate dehydratase n=1 Tax=Janibacter sp. Soil728 TaxID=1736393 RepID=UPI0006F3CF7E|nr:type II 3-dehydroquinate dehydratase [Janibacter sp. Soil728]KRE39484.1 3-dehydroquinate dehydratase [Janibacter sp. Soil728]
MSPAPALVVLNGPNLNLLGEREPEVYGHETLADVEALCRARTDDLGWRLDFRQTNHEGVMIDAIHEVRASAIGLVVNAAGWTHTSVAIRDALAAVRGPVIEVHISDVHAREAFRHFSFITDVSDEVIVGRGVRGYVEAIDAVGERVREG